MNRTRSLLVLVTTMVVVVLTGFALDTGTEPRPLQAQSECGRFNGKLCNKNCSSFCPDGSCCNWNYYYYEGKTEQTPATP